MPTSTATVFDLHLLSYVGGWLPSVGVVATIALLNGPQMSEGAFTSLVRG